ncbi:MAG TPA: hypothetical protein PLJ48_10405, partial [Dermatophilaceae bacterium]|nr:hypothetical protein [Dermatophilaceae bacterium]
MSALRRKLLRANQALTGQVCRARNHHAAIAVTHQAHLRQLVFGQEGHQRLRGLLQPRRGAVIPRAIARQRGAPHRVAL